MLTQWLSSEKGHVHVGLFLQKRTFVKNNEFYVFLSTIRETCLQRICINCTRCPLLGFSRAASTNLLSTFWTSIIVQGRPPFRWPASFRASCWTGGRSFSWYFSQHLAQVESGEVDSVAEPGAEKLGHHHHAYRLVWSSPARFQLNIHAVWSSSARKLVTSAPSLRLCWASPPITSLCGTSSQLFSQTRTCFLCYCLHSLKSRKRFLWKDDQPKVAMLLWSRRRKQRSNTW